MGGISIVLASKSFTEFGTTATNMQWYGRNNS